MYKIKLSPYHKIFYNEWQISPSRTDYTIVSDQLLNGNLCVNQLRVAIKKFVNGYVLLNSKIEIIEEEPYWVKSAYSGELNFFANPVPDLQLYQYIKKPFDLHVGELYRFFLIKYSANEFRFIAVCHHILLSGLATDGGIFINLLNCYNDNNFKFKFSWDKQIHLLNLLSSKLNTLINNKLEQSKQFWQNKLTNLEPLDLRFLRLGTSKTANKSEWRPKFKEIRFNFDYEIFIQTNVVARKHKITAYLLGQIIFAYLLHRYTGQNKLGISYPIAIREGRDSIYGAQINTTIITYDFEKIVYFEDVVREVKQFIADVKNNRDFDYRYCPVYEIIDITNKGLLDVAFIQTNLKDMPFEFTNIKLVKINSNLDFDFTNKLIFEQEIREQQINFRVKYDLIEINEDMLVSFINCYKRLYCQILQDEYKNTTQKLLNEYSILSSNDWHKIVYEWNTTCQSYPENKMIHQLFEEQAAKSPHNVAVVYEDKQLTYQELNFRSNQLAHYLKNIYQIKGDDLIALCIDRSEYLLIVILAILKSGGAYVPIDPGYPIKRIRSILDGVKAKVLLTNEIHYDKLMSFIHSLDLDRVESPYPNIVVIDSNEFINILDAQPNTNISANASHNNLAYVIYTSGTTGKPNGVMIEHKSLTSFVCGFSAFPLNHEIPLNMLSTTNYGFDIFGLEYALPLINGYTVYLANLLNNDNYKLDLKKYDCIQITPSKVELLIDAINYNVQPSHTTIKHKIKILIGGEVLNQHILHKLRELNNKLLNNQNIYLEIINVYGPTETTIWSTCYLVDLTKGDNNISIGRPLSNQFVYILDHNLNLMPIGAIGEIYIGGSGLARGYLNLPELTQKKFIVNPFQTDVEKKANKHNRLYKTGDLARYLPNGNLEYICRNDAQVKILGNRIELGEIETALINYSGVKQAVVLAKQYADFSEKEVFTSNLVAYYVADSKLDEESILDQLSRTLPQYMIPSALVYLDKLPLTINGKLNKNELPRPNLAVQSHHVFPRNELENKLVAIWSEVLGVPEEYIGMTDSFFKLGGNSILIVKLKNKLAELVLFEKITVADLFRYTTIEQLLRFSKYRGLDEKIKIREKLHIPEIDIAIIAMSGTFSGCDNIEKYWNLIEHGLEGTTKFTVDECRKKGISEILLENPNFIPISGHVNNIDKFDNKFWNLSPKETEQLDPHIRKFLEICWFLLENSGYISERQLLNIGVFAGGAYSRYKKDHKLIEQELFMDMWQNANLGVASALSTQTSYLLGLNGPSININTACSTSLVAIVEACQQLLQNSCDLAIAGGVSLLMPKEVGHIYQSDMIFSADGHCRTFDVDATGIVIGCGAGAVLLKRLSDAERDNDHILAVIKGYAINNDGNRKMGYTAPSIDGQMECIINAQKMAGITSDMVNYVECHGTGTKLGDLVEISALDKAFKYNLIESTQASVCTIGSVKANIGHADIAAGIASLIKVCKMIEHGILPKQINYSVPHPDLSIDTTNFEINTITKKWKRIKGLPRIAGVSSFGIGGTNAHVIVSEYIPDDKANLKGELANAKQNSIDYILPLSAKSMSSLNAYKTLFIKYLENTSNELADIAYTLQIKREHFDYRTSIVCNSIENAIHKLEVADVVMSKPSTQQDIIFMFSGQGSQYVNMSLNLYQRDRDYKQIVDRCISIANNYLGINFEEILFPTRTNNINFEYDINQTQWAQLALFIINYSLAILIEEHLKIKPRAYIGHSVGELVAATLSGVFSLKDAIKVVISRGKLMQKMPSGSMLSILAQVDEIQKLIYNKDCEISVINSSQNCIVSGSLPQLEILKYELDQNNITSKLLNVSHAYHSKYMEVASKEFVCQLAGMKLNKPVHKFISNVSGKFITEEDATNPEYWGRHIRNRVLFGDGISTILECFAHPFFIGFGGGKSLLSYVKHQYKSHSLCCGVNLLNSIKEDIMHDIGSKSDIISKLWNYGYSVDFHKYYLLKKKLYKSVPLPNYCFDSRSFWIKQSIDKNYTDILPKNEWLNAPVWKKIEEYQGEERVDIQGKTFLIFIERSCTWLDSLVPSNNNVIFVKIDHALEDWVLMEDGTFIINPMAETAYQAVAKSLKENNTKPNIVIHAVTLSDNKYVPNTKIEENLVNGFYSLYLVQYYILSCLLEAKFVVLTQEVAKITDTDIVNPYNGAMVGAVRTINHELSNIKSNILDIGDYTIFSSNYILQFIASTDNLVAENLYAIKFRALWAEHLEKITLMYKPAFIENGDVILITGGLGGIGLSIAHKLSTEYKLKFVLVNRSDIRKVKNADPYRLNQLNIIKDIESRQCIVDIQCIDIADRDAVNYLITYICKKHGTVTGIIHCAGSPPLPPHQKTLQHIKSAIKAKVYGVENLSFAVKNLKIKYFIMMSSLASILGDVNRIEYCAANSYLDYVSVSDLLPKDCNKLAINWPGWVNIGMFRNVALNNQNINMDYAVLLNTLSEKEGVQLFYEIIKIRGHSQIAISKLDIKLLTQRLFEKNNLDVENIDDIKGKVMEELLPTLYYQIAAIFVDVLAVEKLSIFDNFFDLGGTSLTAIKLIAHLKQIGMNLTLADIMTTNNIDAIYKFHEDSLLEAKSHEIIVPLCINNAKDKNIFFIHAVGGSIIFYLDMVKRLSKNYNYFGIQNINMSGVQLVDVNTFEELAKIYVSEILKIQPDGEYILMGSSLGGTMSYEMSQQLIALGKTVKYIVMFDSWAIFSEHFKDEKNFRIAMEEQIKYDKSTKKLTPIHHETLINARWELMNLLLNYQPQKSSINIHLYKARDIGVHYGANGDYYDNGWQNYTNIPMTIHIISGNHDTIHIEPGLTEIIEFLNDSLKDGSIII